MRWLAWGLVSGCIFDVRTSKVGDGCDEDWDCGSDLRCNGDGYCVDGCVDDSECTPPFGCGTPDGTDLDAYGCVQRCTYDDDCQAGYVCAQDGDCVEPGG